ncbi:hypothetical protein V6N13_078720 [Hibiscus sabdariffa]
MKTGQAEIVFANPEDNAIEKRPVGVDGPPLRGSSSVDGQSHIPSPCGAASLLLPLGTGHETNIQFFFSFGF